MMTNCIQHQVANLAGSLTGTSGGTPILWGAAVEGPADSDSSGIVDGMVACPAGSFSKFTDTFAIFNGEDVNSNTPYNKSNLTYYRDNVQSYTTTEPAVDLTANSMLMWAWRMNQNPSFSY